MITTDAPFLMVDDSLTMRQTVTEVLNSAGFGIVHTASNGREALELVKAAKAKKTPYKVIFLDWNMPEMDGLAFLKICRADQDMEDVAIIMLTAVSDQKNVILALNCGATSYITKPVVPETILKKIEQLKKWFEAQEKRA